VGISGVESVPQESYVVSALQCLMAFSMLSDYYSRKKYKPHIPKNTKGEERVHTTTTFLHNFCRDMLSVATLNFNEAQATGMPYLQEFIKGLSCQKEPAEVLKKFVRSINGEFRPHRGSS
jgi:ubiquitin C-terminal hydrolase